MTIPCDINFLEAIQNRGAVSGIGPAGGFQYQFDFSIPQIAVAIHAGHTVRQELLPYMAISSKQRQFEEDTGTDFMIQGRPNAIWGLESRAVYDLNRDARMALPLIPEKFWGTRVYQKQPTPEMNNRSLDSHAAFYQAMGAVITHMCDRFGYCVVYDIHSYNITRQQANGFENPPVFNLGTAALDRIRWKEPIESWLNHLAAIALPGIETTVAENEVFYGKGEFCKQLSSWDPRILVLPTEVSKVYMDEINGTIYPNILQALREGLEKAMDRHLV